MRMGKDLSTELGDQYIMTKVPSATRQDQVAALSRSPQFPKDHYQPAHSR